MTAQQAYRVHACLHPAVLPASSLFGLARRPSIRSVTARGMVQVSLVWHLVVVPGVVVRTSFHAE